MLKRRIALISVLLGFWGGAAHAYIPPSEYLVTKIAEKHKNFGAILLTSIISVPGTTTPPTGPSAPASFPANGFKEVALIDFKRKTIESHAYDASGYEVFSVKRNLGEGPSNRIPLMNFLFFEEIPEEVNHAMILSGVSVMLSHKLQAMENEIERRAAEKSYLDRWNDRVAWVIGERPEDKGSLGKPRIYIEKDSFLPLRWVGALTANPDRVWDVTFDRYRFVKGYQYPNDIVLLEDGAPVLKAEVSSLIVGPDLKKSPFDKSAQTASGGAASDLLKKYYTVLR
ncbi:MAG: hypothetical protein AB7P04_06065 [Bacteriovoracia bacterium]